ncbi:hypothetical protein [Asaia krungthepensis]|uniref:hypothetical protein n=1 Tax=Asaia krungthepensis TaxID=220990 RepID=UPI002231DFE2|nr:hypothetical protein [Asaia krungthepensis]
MRNKNLCLTLATVTLGGMPASSGVCMARGFSTVLPLHVEVPSTASPASRGSPSEAGSVQWEPAPLPRAMAAPPIRRTTAGKAVDFVKQFLPIGEGTSGHDPVTGAAIGAFGPAYQNASLVGHGLAPPGETVGR